MTYIIFNNKTEYNLGTDCSLWIGAMAHLIIVTEQLLSNPIKPEHQTNECIRIDLVYFRFCTCNDCNNIWVCHVLERPCTWRYNDPKISTSEITLNSLFQKLPYLQIVVNLLFDGSGHCCNATNLHHDHSLYTNISILLLQKLYICISTPYVH